MSILWSKKQKTLIYPWGKLRCKLRRSSLTGLREASKDAESVALDICEDEIADLLELERSKEAKTKQSRSRARQLHWVNGILTKVVGLPRVLSLRNLY